MSRGGSARGQGRPRNRALVALAAALVVVIGSVGFAGIAVAQEGADADIAVAADGSGDYTSIQAAVDAADDGDVISVAAGTYEEQVVITKSLVLRGEPGATILGPAERETYTVAVSDYDWEPIVFAYGGTSDEAGNVTGPGTISVDVTGFTIDGRGRETEHRNVGVFFRNVDGVVGDNRVRDLGGPETFGIAVYSDSDVAVTGNDVSGYDGEGIFVPGTFGAAPAPNVTIADNTLTGPGMGQNRTNNAPVGIQIGGGASGVVRNNTATGHGYAGNTTSSGIIAVAAVDVAIEDNVLRDNEEGIGVYGVSGTDAVDVRVGNNVLANNTYGMGVGSNSIGTAITGNRFVGNEYGLDNWGHGNTIADTTISNNSFVANEVHVDDTLGVYGIADVFESSAFDTAVIVGDRPVDGAPAPREPAIYGSIEGGLESANASDHVVVYGADHPGVDGGRYDEAVNLSVEGATLVGVGGPVVDAGGSRVGVRINGDLGDVTVEGVTVRNWSVAGIAQPVSRSGGTASHVRNNVVLAPGDGATVAGKSIQVWGDGSTVRANEVEVTGLASTSNEPTSGILVGGNRTRVEGNHVYGVEGGPEASNRSGITVSGHRARGVGVADDTDTAGVVGSVLVANNTVEDVEFGIDVVGNAVDTAVRNNTVRDNRVGVRSLAVDGAAPTRTAITGNRIVNNEVGVGSTSADGTPAEARVNATLNWWGDRSGPSGAGPGTGDSVGGNVVFEPWLAPELAVRDARLGDRTPAVGDVVTATADLENVGRVAGEFEVALAVGDTVVGTRTVTLAPGERAEVAYEHAFEEPGEFTLRLNGERVGTVSVRANGEPAGTVSARTASAGETTTAGQPGFGIVAVLIALLVVAGVEHRRRS